MLSYRLDKGGASDTQHDAILKALSLPVCCLQASVHTYVGLIMVGTYNRKRVNVMCFGIADKAY